ncbi:hypothetical protein GOODEAATRI_023377, partial [Goodea atripinnis]
VSGSDRLPLLNVGHDVRAASGSTAYLAAARSASGSSGFCFRRGMQLLGTKRVPVTYEPDPADLALSSVPGQEMFDPRKRKFSAEELKPQPMIKKARKVFIPEDLKVTFCY